MLNQFVFWPAMCCHQVKAQPPQRGIYQSLKRYLQVAVIFVQAKLEICLLGIYTDVADLNGRK